MAKTRANTNRKQSTSGKGKTSRGIAILLAVLLVIVALQAVWYAGWGITGKINPLEWGKGAPVAEEQEDNSLIAVTSEGEKLLAGNSYIMPRSMSLVARSSTYAPTGEITLTASLSNTYILGKFDWSVEYADGSSDVTEVKITPTSDGSSKAVLKCLARFDKQIVVTVALRGGYVEESCTIDCLQMVNNDAFDFSPLFGFTDFGDELEFAVIARFGKGNVLGDITFKSAQIELWTGFITEFKSYLNFDIQVNAVYEITSAEFLGLSAYGSDKRCNFDGQCAIDYSMFIEDFESYDDAHKNAIYFAWYAAADKIGEFVSLKVSCYYSVCGAQVAIMSTDSESVSGKLMGVEKGGEAVPDVSLNTNVVF